MRRFLAVSLAVISCAIFPRISLATPLPQGSPAALPQYPDSEAGLKSFIEDIFSALRYGETSSQVPANARTSFESVLRSGGTAVETKTFGRPVPVNAVGLNWAAIEASKDELHFYTASGTGPSQQYGSLIGRFAYIDGKFRLLSDRVLRGLSTAPPLRIRVGGQVQQAKLARQVKPVYPDAAKASRTEGVVSLHVVIAIDGSVKQVDLVRGDPLLAKAAADAVNQWRYQPTLLEGDPVEVDTLIDVTFRR